MTHCLSSQSVKSISGLTRSVQTGHQSSLSSNGSGCHPDAVPGEELCEPLDGAVNPDMSTYVVVYVVHEDTPCCAMFLFGQVKRTSKSCE